MIAALLMMAQAPAGSATPPPAPAPAAAPFAASGLVRWRDLDLPVEFHAAGDVAVLTARLPDGTVRPIRQVAGVNDAVAILADQRLAFAWPALLGWAGSDLTALRDRALARATVADAAGFVGAGPQDPSEQYAGSATALATFQLSTALWHAGRRDDALALLRKRIAAAPTGDGGYTRVALGDRLAGWMFETGDASGAATLLEGLRSDPRIAPNYRINADVNAALIAARAGQARAALVIVTDALARYHQLAGDDEANVKVPDSEAHFAWIKACALGALGRRDEAAALMRDIAPAADGAADPTVRMRATLSGYRCLHDAAGLARELARELEDAEPGSGVFASIQPEIEDYAPDRAMTAAALREPVLVAAMKGKARLLPAVFRPATSGWRAGALDVDAARR